MLVLNLRAFENKKYAAYDRFYGNGPYGEILTKKEPIGTLRFAVPYNKPAYYPYTKRIDFLFLCGFFWKPKDSEVTLGSQRHGY